MTSTRLYLFHTLPDMRLLATWISRHHARHARQSIDIGDALHGLLHAAFGPDAPQPFRYLDEQRGLLAYTTLDEEAITAHVAKADPLAAQTLGLHTSSAKAGYRLRSFPTRWRTGQELGFEVRLRPTVRGARGEQDAFLHAVSAAGGAQGTPVQRQEVYAGWLRDRLHGKGGEPRHPWQGAVELLDVKLAAFSRTRIVRRTQSAHDPVRKAHSIDGPDTVLTGILRVMDTEAFGHLIKRGIGRHRAFGFGMLLLRPAG